MGRSLAHHYLSRLAPARRVLDLGCGTGELGRYRPSNMELHGVDIDPHAAARASRFEISICHDITAGLPYPAATFDGVLARDIFEHVTEPAVLVREVHRVLRDGGVLVASVVMARPSRVWADYTHVRGFTKASVRMLVEDAGFRVGYIWPMGGVPLTNRLNLIPLVPYLLRVPIFDQLWAASWELVAWKRT